MKKLIIFCTAILIVSLLAPSVGGCQQATPEEEVLIVGVRFSNAPVTGAIVVFKGFGEGTWDGPYAAGVTDESGEVTFPALNHDTWNEIYVSVPTGGVTINSGFIQKTLMSSMYSPVSADYMEPMDKNEIAQSGRATIHLSRLGYDAGFFLQPEPAKISVARGGTVSITIILSSTDYEGEVGLGAIRTPGGGLGWYEPGGLHVTSDAVDLILEREPVAGAVQFRLKPGDFMRIPVTVTADSNVALGIYDVLLWTSFTDRTGTTRCSNPALTGHRWEESRWTMFLVEVK